jgi:hypothetical protein
MTRQNAQARRVAADGGEPVTDGGVLTATADMERCDGCGVRTVAPERYGRIAAGTGPYTVAYCPRCDDLRKSAGIAPEEHTQYRLREEVPEL